MSVIVRFQSTGVVPRNAQPVTMRGSSLTIGRGLDNDIVLPDPDRQVSKTHCVIEDHGGAIFAIDLSTNGTFLNYSKVPMGRNPTAVNDGDVLSLGPYELVLEFVQAALQDDFASPAPRGLFEDDLLPPADIGPASHGRASRAPDPMALLDDSGPGVDFLDSLLGDPKGPKGHKTLKMGQMDPDELLPPLDDDDLLGPAKPTFTGPAMRDNSTSASDSFRPAAPTRSVIPDDWEDDLLAPAPAAPARGPSPFITTPPRSTPIPDAFDDFLAPPPAVTPPAIPEEVGPADDLDMLLGPAPTPPAPVAPPDVEPEPVAAFVPPPAPVAATQPAAPQPAAAQPVASGAEAAAIRAFLEGLGATDIRLTDEELVLTMGRLGGTLRTMIAGLREILMTRTSIKSEFRIDQTMITVGKNNPLKFSISPEQAVEAMTRPAVKGYLEAEEAAKQALDDLKAHEIGMVTGMEAALKGVLARLDPAVLTTKIESGGGLGSMFRGKKAQYWETYEKMYAEIADQAENDFHDLFSREFAQAYKDQLARLKQGQ